MAAVDGFATVGIASQGGALEAHFVPDANMLCHSLTHRGVELLHAGRGVQPTRSAARRWASRCCTRGPTGSRAAGVLRRRQGVTLPPPDGRYALDPNGLPIHGALPGLLRWEVLDDRSDRTASAPGLDWSDPELMELFPFAHELRSTRLRATPGWSSSRTLRATGADAVPVSFGYHPYLRPPGEAPRADWQVSLGASERLVLDGQMIPTGATVPLEPRRFAMDGQSWDDGLVGLASPPEFSVSAGAQTVTVTFDDGFAYAQVFAPEGQDFICFEPMTAPTNALEAGHGLTPGGARRGVPHRVQHRGHRQLRHRALHVSHTSSFG